MKFVGTDHLRAGDVLCSNVYFPDGRVCLRAGNVLTERLIASLQRLRMNGVYIEVPGLEGIVPDHGLDEDDRMAMIVILKKQFDAIKAHGTCQIHPLIQVANRITDLVLAKPNFLVQFKDVRSEETALYAHSITVCMLSVLMAKSLEYNALQIKQVAVGALLHDIGYACADLQRPAQDHAKRGFDLLRSFHEVHLMSAHMVLQHHEMVNGQGFPLGVRGKEFREFAQICGVANEYDHFINHPNSQHLPHEGIEYIMSKAGTAFDVELVKTFIGNIAPYPVGTTVRLSNNMQGRVWKVEKDKPSRPVLCLNNQSKLNLFEYPTLFVKEVIS